MTCPGASLSAPTVRTEQAGAVWPFSSKAAGPCEAPHARGQEARPACAVRHSLRARDRSPVPRARSRVAGGAGREALRCLPSEDLTLSAGRRYCPF